MTHGRILVNGQAHAIDNSGPRVYWSKCNSGTNLIEAFLEPGLEADGFWEFNFRDTPNFVRNSLKVESGEVSSLDGQSVIFVVSNSNQRIRFSFELKGQVQ